MQQAAGSAWTDDSALNRSKGKVHVTQVPGLLHGKHQVQEALG